MENIEITFKKRNGRLAMETPLSMLGSLYDNRAKQFIFTRPEEYAQCDLVLAFMDEEQEFAPVNLGRGNQFEVLNTLTQTQSLQLQVAFERDGDAIVHSNILRFWLRPSIPPGAQTVEELPDMVRQVYRGAMHSVESQGGELRFFNMSGDELGRVKLPTEWQAPGQGATITIGSVATGEPGSHASISNSGSERDLVLDFVIPRGAGGLQGEPGPQGKGPSPIDFTILASAWRPSTRSKRFGFEASLPMPGVTRNDRVEPAFNLSSYGHAKDAGVAGMAVSVTGSAIFYSTHRPEADLAGTYLLFKGDGVIHTILGTSWNYGNPSPVLERIEDAAGLTVTSGIGADAGHSDFDSAPIYKNIRRCNLAADGAVIAYEGEPAFTFTPPNGVEVMVEIPLFYHRAEDDTSNMTRRTFICDRQADSLLPHPAFARPTGTANKIYIGAYETSAGHRSVSGALPLVEQTRAQFRTGARAKGTGWGIVDIAAKAAITDLALIELANNDIQAAIGPGNTSSGGPLITGRTDGIVGSGREAGQSPAASSVVWRGIENWWGNVWEWVDGLNVNNGEFWFCADPSRFADSTTAGYTQLSYPIPTGVAGSFFTRLGFDPAAPWLGLPQAGAGGSATTFLADGGWWSATGWRNTYAGGNWAQAGRCGLFAWVFAAGVGAAGTHNGARLMYIPAGALDH
ncbi:MAG: hypothetical protein FWE19_05395 [Oscillospiraceae bacterium]|nr:hypothetical protein [Oscillospiraceae bacterium]